MGAAQDPGPCPQPPRKTQNVPKSWSQEETEDQSFNLPQGNTKHYHKNMKTNYCLYALNIILLPESVIRFFTLHLDHK